MKPDEYDVAELVNEYKDLEKPFEEDDGSFKPPNKNPMRTSKLTHLCCEGRQLFRD